MRKNRNNTVRLKGIVTNCRKLNVRSRPSRDSDILTTVSEGTELTIGDEVSEDFYAVRKENLRGYCMKDYISVQPQEVNDNGQHTDIG